MVSPALPQRRSPLSSSCLRPPPRPGGPACRSLARSAAGDGWNAPHETPGPPLPPPGEAPSPLGLCRPAAAASSSPASSCSASRRPLLTRPSFPAAPVGPRAASPRRRSRARGVRWASLPPPRAPVTWGGGSRPGSSDPAAAAFLSFYLLYLFFSFLFFFFFLLFFLPSLFLSFPLASEGGGRQRDYFFPRRRDLRAPPSGGDEATTRNRIRWWRRDPRRAEGGEAAGRPLCSLTLLLSAALRRRRLRRCGRSLRPHGQLAAAQAGHAALRVAAGGDGTGHDGGGFSAPPQPSFRVLAVAVAFAAASPGAQGT